MLATVSSNTSDENILITCKYVVCMDNQGLCILARLGALASNQADEKWGKNTQGGWHEWTP